MDLVVSLCSHHSSHSTKKHRMRWLAMSVRRQVISENARGGEGGWGHLSDWPDGVVEPRFLEKPGVEPHLGCSFNL